MWEKIKKTLKDAKLYVTPGPPDGLLLAGYAEDGDYAEVSVWAIFKVGDSYAAYSAGCDTTGWDCQAHADLETFDTPGKAVAAIEDRARPYLVWAHEVL